MNLVPEPKIYDNSLHPKPERATQVIACSCARMRLNIFSGSVRSSNATCQSVFRLVFVFKSTFSCLHERLPGSGSAAWPKQPIPRSRRSVQTALPE